MPFESHEGSATGYQLAISRVTQAYEFFSGVSKSLPAYIDELPEDKRARTTEALWNVVRSNTKVAGVLNKIDIKTRPILEFGANPTGELKQSKYNHYGSDSLSLLDSYLQDSFKFPRITQEEARVLSAKVVRGDMVARDRLVTGTLGIAFKLAKRFKGVVELEDLVQEANEALVIVANNYTAIDRRTFVSASYHAIISRLRWRVRPLLTKNGLRLHQRDTITGVFQSEGGVEDAVFYSAGNGSFSSEDDPITKVERIETQQEAKMLLRKGLDRIPKREASVLERLYGANGERKYEYSEVESSLGVNHQRVVQIRRNGLTNLKLGLGRTNFERVGIVEEGLPRVTDPSDPDFVKELKRMVELEYGTDLSGKGRTKEQIRGWVVLIAMARKYYPSLSVAKIGQLIEIESGRIQHLSKQTYVMRNEEWFMEAQDNIASKFSI